MSYQAVWWRLFHAPDSSSWLNILTLARLLFTLPVSNGESTGNDDTDIDSQTDTNKDLKIGISGYILSSQKIESTVHVIQLKLSVLVTVLLCNLLFVFIMKLESFYYKKDKK